MNQNDVNAYSMDGNSANRNKYWEGEERLGMGTVRHHEHIRMGSEMIHYEGLW